MARGRPRLLTEDERRANHDKAVQRWRAAHPLRVKVHQRRGQARYAARKRGLPVPVFGPVEEEMQARETGGRVPYLRLQPVIVATPVSAGRWHGWRCTLACGHSVPGHCRHPKGQQTHLPPRRLGCWCTLPRGEAARRTA
jgi:hypothetical protein